MRLRIVRTTRGISDRFNLQIFRARNEGTPKELIDILNLFILNTFNGDRLTDVSKGVIL